MRLAFSMTISAIWMCLLAGSSKVELMTSPLTLRSMSVTSSGRSSMRRTMRCDSGLFFAMLLAIFCSRIVLPVRGGATMRPRWPFPIGVIRSMIRISIASRSVSRMNRSSGYSGVRSSNTTLFIRISGSSRLIASTLRSAK